MQAARIAIVGCGPGGLAAALLLHRAGHAVTLFEQFDAPRPLGSGLLVQPSGQIVLHQLGLLDNLRRLSAPVLRLSGLAVPSGKRALAMEYRWLAANAHALGVHRASLFDVLFGAVIAAGLRILPDHRLIGVQAGADGVCPKFADQPSGDMFDLMVDAAGAHSPLASGQAVTLPYSAFWTTIDRPPDCEIAIDALEQRYHAAMQMAGAMPIGINPATGNPGLALFWSVARDGEAQFRADGITAFRRQWAALWPEATRLVDAVRDMDALVHAVYRHRTGSGIIGSRILQIGDAWHCTSPQLGQGANMALIDAAALAETIAQARDPEQVAAHYLPRRRLHIRLYQSMSQLLTPLYQSDNAMLPIIRDLAVHHIAHLPFARRVVAKIVSGGVGQR